MTLRNAALLPLQSVILLALHFIFALSRLVVVIIHLTAFFPRPVPPPLAETTTPIPATTASLLQRDQLSARWSKSPKHLAVVFVPSSNLLSSAVSLFRRRRKQHADVIELAKVDKLVKDLTNLVAWCESLGVESLSVYDEEGLLERHSMLVRASLRPLIGLFATESKSNTNSRPFSSLGRTSFTVLRENDGTPGRLMREEREVDSGCGASEVEADHRSSTSASITLVPSTTTSDDHKVALPLTSITPLTFALFQKLRHRSPVRVNLLSRDAGRPFLAEVARELAREVTSGQLGDTGVDAEFVQERVELTGIADPDLLIVLGGPYLRLRGFPPWQLRLTEMYHHSSPSWLPPPPITYSILRSALDVYGGAEMRLGR